jgi:hypothetical protein
VVLDRIEADPSGNIGPPEAGEVVMSVLSPEGLRNAQEVRDAVGSAEAGDEAVTIVVRAAEELREDELAVVLDAARRADRLIIVRIAADA